MEVDVTVYNRRHHCKSRAHQALLSFFSSSRFNVFSHRRAAIHLGAHGTSNVPPFLPSFLFLSFSANTRYRPFTGMHVSIDLDSIHKYFSFYNCRSLGERFYVLLRGHVVVFSSEITRRHLSKGSILKNRLCRCRNVRALRKYQNKMIDTRRK